MSKVFIIPGLGIDCRIYRNIDLHNYNTVKVEWIDPDKNDTLTTYAQKLIDKYHITAQSIVIGNSMGGMIAIEIAKKVELNKTILISSIKSVNEFPGYFKFFRITQLHRIISAKKLASLEFIIEHFFGGMSENDQQLFDDMLKKISPVFMAWAINAILKWDNHTIPKNVYHVHGNRDRVFPYKNIKNAEIIKDATHVAILNNSKEINIWLKGILKH